nr:hypothetical protein [Luteimonas huabeiensis]
MGGIALKGGRASDAGMTGMVRIAAVAVLALAGAAVWLRVQALGDTGAARLAPAPVAAVAEAPAATASPAPPATAAAAPDAPGEVAARRRLAMPAAGRSEALRQAFERDPDLHALSRVLAPAAQAGDPEALWTLSRIHDYCAGFAASPAGYARDSALLDGLGVPGATAMSRSRGRVAQRCQGFAATDAITVSSILRQRQAAAEAGHLAAEASLLAMGAPLEDSPAYRRDLARRVRDSGDPDAISALSSGMGVAASGDRAYDGLVAGTQFAELAWRIAGCRAGLDCGPDSALMTTYCADGGICSQDPAQDFESFVYDAAVPRQGAEVVGRMVDALLQGGSERTER